MRFFVCLLDPTGRAVVDTARRAYEVTPRRRDIPFQWHRIGEITVLTGGDDLEGGPPLVASDGDCVAAGTVRLDNRQELECWSGCTGRGFSDLELVLRAVARHGTTHVPQILGDFAFLVWNATSRTLVAGCDAFGVKKLYYAERNGHFTFASRAEAIALEDRYDVQYLAEGVAGCAPSPGVSVYSGVRSLPGGTLATIERGRLITRRYWSAYDFDVKPSWARAEHEAAETCRNLLAESVRLRIGREGETWAQLSGGLDSSSNVSVTQWLAERGVIAHGLAGTVTYVDGYGTGGDEREYSDAVANRWRVRNEKIIDAPIWHDESYEPPQTDQPSAGFESFPRDCRISAIVRGASGRVLLTGIAGDTLFTGYMFFFADWLARGRILSAVREMARRAAVGRASVWELAYRNALLPLLPTSIQHRLVQDAGQMPPWMQRALVSRYELHKRAFATFSYAGRIGRKYHDAMAAGVTATSGNLPIGVLEDSLDVRHPFLYRPLVEYALTLPPELCVRPQARKWVLREAMKGILPEVVRTRVGKGSLYGRLAWSLRAQRSLFEPLIRDPILADLGVVDAVKLRAAFAAARDAPDGRQKIHNAIQQTLVFEAWLQMRAGRWPRGGHTGSAVSPSNRPSI